MSKIVKISENYRLKVPSSGSITLDTGASVGTVVITGNLDVKGLTTTIESSNTTVKDNILQINYGQTGPGISAVFNYQAGIQIGRGSRSDAKLVFDETVYHYDPVLDTTVPGTFVFKLDNDSLTGIQVSSIGTNDATNLVFDMQNSSSIVQIGNSTGYESRVVNDNDVPNRKFVIDYVAATGGTADVDKIKYPLTGAMLSEVQADSNSIQFRIDAGGGLSQRARITASGLRVDNVNIFQNTISNVSPLANLTLTGTSGYIEVGGVLELDDQLNNEASVSGKTKIYSKSTAGPGRTGLYISNVNTADSVTWNPATSAYETGRDELISKNKAVLLSILL
jgi:hypothetical protein